MITRCQGRTRSIYPPWRTFILSLLILCSVWSVGPEAALASVHTYAEQPGQVTYRSRQSVRDSQDRAWQAIAFKRLRAGQLQGVYLRLVGFPGAIVVAPEEPIQVLSAVSQQWQLPWDLGNQVQAFPESVGQYDLQPLLTDLDSPLPLEIQIPLRDAHPAHLKVPPFILKEWLQVKTAGEG